MNCRKCGRILPNSPYEVVLLEESERTKFAEVSAVDSGVQVEVFNGRTWEEVLDKLHAYAEQEGVNLHLHWPKSEQVVTHDVPLTHLEDAL
jgi:transcriptional regulator